MGQGDSQLPLVYLLLLLLKIYINFLAKQQNSNRPFCTDWRQYNIHGGSIYLSRELELPEDSGYLKVPVEDIYSATNNLNESNCIGEGTAGRVYKGILFDNQNVAVKHIIKDGCMETFLREVRSLTHVRHPNLVALLGYGTNDEERFLIYELCPNGNLAQWLFGMDTALSWIKRLEIAIDSARGLQFLHTYPEGSIIHRDIKAKTISTREGSTFGFVDPRLHGEYSVEAFEATFALALACTAPTQQRPCIKEVVTKLEEALAISMKAKASSPQSTPQQSTLF
nr:probable receptor-like protein kinase At5g18500 [Ipomoea batatas]